MAITTAVAITIMAIAAEMRWTKVSAKSANVSTPLTVRKTPDRHNTCSRFCMKQLLHLFKFEMLRFATVGKCSYKTVTGPGKCSRFALCHIDTVEECETGFGGQTKANAEADDGNRVFPLCALLVSVGVLGFKQTFLLAEEFDNFIFVSTQ